MFAACSAITFVVPRFTGVKPKGSGWTVYTPYSIPTSSLSWQVIEAAMFVSSIALPVGLLAVAAYMAMAERELRGLRAGRGFDVATAVRDAEPADAEQQRRG